MLGHRDVDVYVPDIAKRRITIGSGFHCDIRLEGNDIMVEHAALEMDETGALCFVACTGRSTADGVLLAPGSRSPFDFRTGFSVADLPVPAAHPAITLMLMVRGRLPASPEVLIVGSAPAEVHIAVRSAHISPRHVTFVRNPLGVIDNGSETGTWIRGARLRPETFESVQPNGFIKLGPLGLHVETVRRLAGWHDEAAAAVNALEATLQPRDASADHAPVKPSPRAEVRVISVRHLAPKQEEHLYLGRAEDNEVTFDHRQVSAHHATVHRVGGQTFVEDRGSSNGTYVRGVRIEAGQPVAVVEGEKFFLGPVPVKLQLNAPGDGSRRPPDREEPGRGFRSATRAVSSTPIDVFVGYAHANHEVARQVVEAVEQLGWEVWWDDQLLGGSRYTEEIESALKRARCVLALWSEEAAESHWVRNEGNFGLQRNVLIPILLDPIDLPLNWQHLHAVNLQSWSGSLEDPAFMRLARALSGVCASVATLVPRGDDSEFSLKEGQHAVVGRDGFQCSFVLTDPRVSAVHARLAFQGGKLTVRDENSNNGTWIDGVRITPGEFSPVPPGAVLRFGPLEFTVTKT